MPSMNRRPLPSALAPRPARGLAALAFALTVVACGAPADPGAFDLVIQGGRVLDPETGLDAVRHVGIRDGTIAAISESPLEGRDTLAAAGRVVAPGFIDLNTYQHGDALFRLRVADGTTTVLMLEGGAVDVPAYYAGLAGTALAHYGTAVDHQTLRRIAAGDTTVELHLGMPDWPGLNAVRAMPELDDRALEAEELDTLAVLVERGLEAGALAVSFGVQYTPGATHTEVLRMVRLAADHGAPAHLHGRDFHTVREWGDIYEIIATAAITGTAVHLSHLQSMHGGFTGEALTLFEGARARGLRVGTDCYPYIASATFIDWGDPDAWRAWPDERFHRMEWPSTGERLTRESYARYRAQGGLVIFHPEDPESREQAVRECLAHPLAMIASDGAWDSGRTHPRVAGTNARVLGRYVRDEGVLTLMEAVRKLSLEPARYLEERVPEMARKGRLQPGADADIVVFDPETVQDRATYAQPTLPSAGIDAVLVGGVPVLLDGVILEGRFPGGPVRGPTAGGGP